MSPILDLQKRSRELGRIRIGQVVPTTKRDGTTGTRPEKLDRFRLTSHSKPLLEKVAQLYGGEVVEWQPQGGGTKAWEVITTSNRLPIMVPPQPVTQWYEYWTAAGCQHRCDGNTNVLTDELCDPEDFAHREAVKKPTTRLNVVLRDVEGIGVWRLETHGFNAAVELPDAAEFLAAAGGYVNGWVSLEPRTSKAEVPDRKNGGTKIETRHFMVPIIEIDVTPAELMAGRGRVATPSIEGPVPHAPAAIEAPTQKPAEVVIPTPQEIAAADAVRLHEVIDYLASVGLAEHPASAAARQRLVELVQQPDADGVVDAEIVEPPTPAGPEPDPDVVWQQILAAGGQRGMTLADIEDDVVAFLSMSSAEASGAELAEYLTDLQGRPSAAGAA